MKDYRNILVAVDLSSDSSLVLNRARAIAAQHQAELSLVHVMEPLAIGFTSDVTGAYFESMYVEAMRNCRESMLKLCESAGIPQTRSYSIMGSPAREIRNVAKMINADFIVVGGHGKHGLELLLGATSSAVTHGVTCDLLIVRMPH